MTDDTNVGPYVVGCVPYLNAKPLVRQFEELGQASPVKVVYDVPSSLPSMLASGEAQAILVSSIEALRSPAKRVAAGICIGSRREVLSVRLFSKVEPNKVRSLALDRSSMTSNSLAKLVLRKRYGVVPSISLEAPDLEAMLRHNDACVLIGDNGMRTDGTGFHVLDLGVEWFEMTGLPFVWAVWMGEEGLSEELARLLHRSAAAGMDRIEAIVAEAAPKTYLDPTLCRRYLVDVMRYPMGEAELAGLKRFGELLAETGEVGQVYIPILVGS